VAVLVGGRQQRALCCCHGIPQCEHRTYWQASGVYHAFNPLLFADQSDRPVLIMHGVEDENLNTSPDQAIALYQAIIATGGHVGWCCFPARATVTTTPRTSMQNRPNGSPGSGASARDLPGAMPAIHHPKNESFRTGGDVTVRIS
jgi:hypothetical protein